MMLPALPRRLVALLLALVLAGCGAPTPTPLISTPRPTLADATPIPSASAPPAPSATATPAPTDTPTPTPTATPIRDALELVRTFDTARALAYIQELSAPPYTGRRAGTPGADAAANYVAGEFTRLGLLPAGEGGTYLQPFMLPFLDLAATPELSILPSPGVTATAYVHLQDFRERVVRAAGGGTADAEVVYLAGGQSSDFDVLDVEGKIVLVDAALRPEGSSSDPPTFTAIDKGAAGVLIINEVPLGARGSYIIPLAETTRPVFFIARKVADDLAKASGVTLGERPRALGVQAHMKVELLPLAEAQTSNVLGLWPGSDPALQDKTIVVGGHYDHIGQLPSGVLFPGASDNASGVAVMLALVQTWKDSGFQPRASVLFVAWGAEEAGLVGSRYYTEHPTRPLDGTLAFINLDALGQGEGDGLTMQHGSRADPSLAIQLANAANALGYPSAVGTEDASDHASFDTEGVPAALVIAAGQLTHLHRPSDTPETIEEDNVRQAGQITWLTLLELTGAWTP